MQNQQKNPTDQPQVHRGGRGDHDPWGGGGAGSWPGTMTRGGGGAYTPLSYIACASAFRELLARAFFRPAAKLRRARLRQELAQEVCASSSNNGRVHSSLRDACARRAHILFQAGGWARWLCELFVGRLARDVCASILRDQLARADSHS